MGNKEKKNSPIQQKTDEKVPNASPLDVKNDITDYECRLIWYLRNIPKEQADDFGKAISQAYCKNKFKIEFKPAEITEPFDQEAYSKIKALRNWGDDYLIM